MFAQCYPKHQHSLLVREDILHHAKHVFEVYTLRPDRGFVRMSCNLLIYEYVLELHCSLLHHVSNEVIFDLNLNK